MKGYLLKILTGAIFVAVVFFGYGSGANAALITKTLDEDTKLLPSGSSAVIQMPVFKKGTTVTLNEQGEVVEGTLANDPWLSCVTLQFDEDGRHYFYRYGYVFRDGSKVTFNNKGEVIKGTFSHNHLIKITVPVNGRDFVILRPLTEVSLHENGILAKGTIDAYGSKYFHPLGWQQINRSTDNPGGFVQFKEETVIEMNDKGEVLKGTLLKDTKLPSPLGIIKVYEAGTTVEFDEQGVVTKATKG